MLNLPSLEGQNLIPFNIDNVITLVHQMSLESKSNQFSRFLILEKSTKAPFPYSIMVFKEQIQPIVIILSQVLGLESDRVINKVIFWILLSMSSSSESKFKFS